jgi:hypothetical protein
MSRPTHCLVVECTTFEQAREKLGHLKDTALTLVLPPNIAGPVPAEFRDEFHLWHIGMLGWEGTLNECICWTPEQAVIKIYKAIAMGYECIFRPPGGVWDPEFREALEKVMGLTYVPPRMTDMIQYWVIINNPGMPVKGENLKFFPGSPRHRLKCQIVNASEKLVVNDNWDYGYAVQHAVQGDQDGTE